MRDSSDEEHDCRSKMLIDGGWTYSHTVSIRKWMREAETSWTQIGQLLVPFILYTEYNIMSYQLREREREREREVMGKL